MSKRDDIKCLGQIRTRGLTDRERAFACLCAIGWPSSQAFGLVVNPNAAPSTRASAGCRLLATEAVQTYLRSVMYLTGGKAQLDFDVIKYK